MYFVIGYLLLTYPFFKKLKNKKLLILIEIFPVFLSLAFQNAIGTDYYNYIDIFHGDYPFYYSNGALFKIIVDTLKVIFNHERSLFIVVSLIQGILYYKIVLKMYDLNVVGDISLFICTTILTIDFYANMANFLRNSVASLFVDFGILCILENKLLVFFIYLIFGVGFHPSVVVWNGIVLIGKFLKRKINVCYICLYVILCLILNKIQFIRKVAFYIYNLNFEFKYKFYLISEHMFPYVKSFGMAVLINFILVLISLIFYRKEKNKNSLFIYNIGYLFWGFTFFFGNIPILARILSPIKFFGGYILYKVLEKTLKKEYYYIGIFILLYYILSFIRGMQLMLSPVSVM